MKKIKLLLFAFMALGALTLVSCEKSADDSSHKGDDGNQGGQTEQLYQVKYILPNLYELTDVATVTAYYTDADGSEKSEILTSPTWSKILDDIEPPFTASLYFRAVRNDDELTKTSYKIGSGCYVFYKLTTDVVWSGNTMASGLAVPADGVDSRIERLNKVSAKTQTIE